MRPLGNCPKRHLPPHTDERVLGEFFRQWGDVATVKIMWPRGEQIERKAGLTGFVAYMTRQDAERAMKEADGITWGGSRVRLSWGKAMPLPNRAMYPMQKSTKLHGEDEKPRREEKNAMPRLVRYGLTPGNDVEVRPAFHRAVLLVWSRLASIAALDSEVALSMAVAATWTAACFCVW